MRRWGVVKVCAGARNSLSVANVQLECARGDTFHTSDPMTITGQLDGEVKYLSELFIARRVCIYI